MYSIRTTYTLNARHALKKGSELIEEPHQHTFMIELELFSAKLDDTGCVVDFRDLDSRMTDILGTYTNADLQDHPQFSGKSPSAEVMAEVFFWEIESWLADMPASLERVTVWEDERHAGSYNASSPLRGED